MKRVFSVMLIAAVAGCTHGGRNPNGGGGDAGTNGGGDDAAPPCSGLACQQVNCGEASDPTTLTGTVYAPNGELPIYNAVVYVPNSTPDTFTDGVTCDRCDGHVSGDPLVQVLTGPDGKFSLVDVPAGSAIPLVIQIGKWRRQVTIDVPPCMTTQVPAEKSRLPKNHMEGDLPRIAISTGSVDPMECLLLKIGLDASEIQEPGHGTRVEFYQAPGSPGTTISPNTPVANDPQNGLYADMKRLVSYDMVILPCEGGEYDQGAQNLSNIVSYVNMGGRVFTTHYSYDWLTYAGSPFNKVAQPQVNNLWPKDQLDYPDDTVVTTTKLVTNFPKGQAFSEWLGYAGAQSKPGTLDIQQIRHDIDGVSGYAQAWATDKITDQFSGKTTPGVAHLTFNTPLDAPKDDMGNPQYCGRVLYSDFHVAQSEADTFMPFPMACMLGPMSDQEKALAFMFFDLSSCVQSDQQPPVG